MTIVFRVCDPRAGGSIQTGTPAVAAGSTLLC